MNNCRFDVVQAGCDVAALSKIGVLVDGTGDEAGDFCYFLRFRAEDEGKTSGEGGGRLHGRKGKLGNVVATMMKLAQAKTVFQSGCIPVSEPKRAFDLIIGGTLCQFSNIAVECS